MSWTPYPRPVWVDRLNAHGSSLGDPRVLVSLDPEELLDQARRMTGLKDFGGPGWRENYDLLLRAIEAESNLHLTGRVLARHDLLLALRNRLLLTDLWSRRPEILSEPVTAPVFIVGSARTGTTLLHEMLATDPATRTPATWEMYHPVQALAGADLVAVTDLTVKAINSVQPEYGTMHYSAGGLPNECIFLTLPMFLGEYWSGCHLVPSYEMHVLTTSHTQAYAYHRRALQTLQQRLPARRWVLKSPTHFGRLGTLFSEYPDAVIIQTHRDPLRTIPSTVSLVGTLKRTRCEEVDLTGWPELIASGTAAGYDRHIAQRASGALPDKAFIDVLYKDLVADPIGVVRGIYDRLGWDFTEATLSGLQRRLGEVEREGHGTHSYSLESLGLDPAVERRRFASYQARFGVLNED